MCALIPIPFMSRVRPHAGILGYGLKTTGGPLTRVALRLTRTSTRSATWRKGMPWVMPKSLRSKAMVPVIAPDPVPWPETVRCRVSGLETPRMVNVPGTSKALAGVYGGLMFKSP